MTRFRAFSTHFLVSAAVVGTFLALTFLVWYPAPYFETEGANGIIWVLAGVDVVLGPLLTFVVFRPGKPRLKLDLGIIIAVQLSAFLYGGYVIFTERPGYIVHVINSFKVVPASAVDFSKCRYPELEPGWFSGPSLVHAEWQKEGESAKAAVARILFNEGDISARAEYYEPYDRGIADVLASAAPAGELIDASEHNAAAVQRVAASHRKDPQSLVSLPLVGSIKQMTLLLDAETAEPLGVIEPRT